MSAIIDDTELPIQTNNYTEMGKNTKQKIFICMNELKQFKTLNSFKEVRQNSINFLLSFSNQNLFDGCNFKTLCKYSFDYSGYIQLRIQISQIKNDKNQLIQFTYYKELVQHFTNQFNKMLSQYQFNSKIFHYLGVNTLTLTYYNLFYEKDPVSMTMSNIQKKITNIFKRIRFDIVQKLLVQILYYRNLQKQHRINLLVFRQFFESQRAFRKNKTPTGNKLSINFRKNKSMNSYVQYPLNCAEVINYQKQVQQRFKRQQKLILQYFNPKSPIKFDLSQKKPASSRVFKRSLYELQKHRQKIVSQIKQKQLFLPVNFRNEICQSIKIIEKQDVPMRVSIDTNISSVVSKKCVFECLFSVHQYNLFNQSPQNSSRDLQKKYPRSLSKKQNSIKQIQPQVHSDQESNHKILVYSQNQQKNNQISQKLQNLELSSSSSSPISTRSNINPPYTLQQQKLIRNLVQKVPISNEKYALKSFKNQYHFIKWIRFQIWPYIAKYYLEGQVKFFEQKNLVEPNLIKKSSNSILSTSNSLKSNPNLCLKSKQKIFLECSSNDKQAQELRPIYIDQYRYNLKSFIQGSQKRFSKLSLYKVNNMLFQICNTLHFLSEKKILHRDLKPANIMIDDFVKVRFIDWGSCCNVVSSENISKSNDNMEEQKTTFPEVDQGVLRTQSYSQDYYDVKFVDYINGIFKNKTNFYKAQYYDIYSFGKLLQHNFLPQLQRKFKSTDDEPHWYIQQLEYLKLKCLQRNPFDRLSAFQLCIHLNQMGKIIKQKHHNNLNSFEQYRSKMVDSVNLAGRNN